MKKAVHKRTSKVSLPADCAQRCQRLTAIFMQAVAIKIVSKRLCEKEDKVRASAPIASCRCTCSVSARRDQLACLLSDDGVVQLRTQQELSVLRAMAEQHPNPSIIHFYEGACDIPTDWVSTALPPRFHASACCLILRASVGMLNLFVGWQCSRRRGTCTWCSSTWRAAICSTGSRPGERSDRGRGSVLMQVTSDVQLPVAMSGGACALH